MTREEAITKYIVPAIERTWNDKICKEILETLEQEPCDDAISRQAVLVAMQNNYRDGGRDIDGDYVEGNYSEKLYEAIISLPSVNPKPKPKPKTGHWIEYDHGLGVKCYQCSNCKGFDRGEKGKYCKWCRAKMVEQKESEDI